MSAIQLALRLILAATFVVAGVAKLGDREGTGQAVAGFGLPDRFAGPMSILLPVAEIAAAVLLIPTATAQVGAALALALLLAFCVVIARSTLRGEAPECHCFGQLHSAAAGPKMLARNLVLAAAAAIVLVGGGGTSATHWVSGLSAAGAVALTAGIALAVIAAATGTLMVSLLRRHGETLLRLDALESTLAAHGIPVASVHSGPEVEGLPVGARAPDFELRDLEHGMVTLASLTETVRPLMLVFTDPGCGPCSALMPEVAMWQREHHSALRIALISRGDLDANRALAREHALTDVMLDHAAEVSEGYGLTGTPGAVLIAPDGTVASPVHGGAEAIASLVALVTSPDLVVRHSDPFVSSPAPDPVLSTLDGDRVLLGDRLNGDTVVLFWNPDCGYCDQMLSDLRSAEEASTPELPNLLLISTGEAARNRAMGLHAPILLDAGFAAGTAFGATGTPSAVLVDDQGQIASPVAAGAPEVLALVTLRGPAVSSA
jgi:peroxiredoxin/thiol-disulfide isomerase/thioredoxin/uncharacterized membrane protein YphA (DoxX/SURF4 family)